MIEPTPEEQIAKHYAACIDSVNLINGGKPEGMEDAEWSDTLQRNRDHLAIMVAKDFWGDTDISALQNAIA